MSNYEISLRKSAYLSAASLLLCFSGSLAAIPVINNESGTVANKNTITIKGTGFGTKSTAAPVIWDDASGTKITDKWTGGYPNASTDSNANLQYRAVGYRGVAGPHANSTKYIVGAHCCGTAANTGIDVMLFKSRTMNSFPQYTYASWYERVDPAWTTTESGMVNNYKIWDFSYGTSPYISDWHINYTFSNKFSSTGTREVNCQVNDNGSTLTRPSYPNWYGQGAEPWTDCYNPIVGGWKKIEVEIKYSTATDGYIRWFTNGDRTLFNFINTKTATGAGTWSEAIGGYTGWYQTAGGSNLKNFRYYADVYLDYSLARVVLANNSDLAKATIVETQIPSAWNDNLITVAVNLGYFSTAGQTAYLFVVDPTGAYNATGFPVTIGTGNNNLLTPPSAVHIVD